MVQRISSLVFLLLSWIAASAWGLDSFEEGMAGWRALGGKAEPSAEHWKLGSRALRWDFSPGAVLVRSADADLKAAVASREGGIMLWLYCEKPVPGALRFQAGPWVFPVNLGFTGWRAVWVVFCEDAQKAAPIEGLQITAPAATGSLFLDAVELGPVPWLRQPDAQAPYTNAGRANGKYWFTTQE